MDKTPEQRIAELEKQLKELKLSLGLDDFSAKIYHSKDEFFKPTTTLSLQNAFINRTNVATVTIASPAVVTAKAHGLIEGQQFTFSTTGALPTGITAGTTYYVSATGLTVDAFQFSATLGGASVNTSGTQSGVHTLNFKLFSSAKLKFISVEGGQQGGGGIYAENDGQEASGYSAVVFAHPTGEVGIRMYGQEVGGGGRAVQLFVGSLDFLEVVDGDGGQNYVGTTMPIDFTPNSYPHMFVFSPDTTAAGAYKGRIPIEVNGTIQYLHYFDA